MLGDCPADHISVVSELTGLLDSKGLSHENYAVFQVSSQSTNWKDGWKKCANL